MRAFPEYSNESPRFWSLVRFVSESLKYSDRKSNKVRSYTVDEIRNELNKEGINASEEDISKATDYLNKRADLLNNEVSNLLMDVDEARQVFESLYEIYKNEGYSSKLPMNKQSKEMKQINYFTAIINILAEKTLRDMDLSSGEMYIDDPQQLVYVVDDENSIVSSTSRRYDGVYPSRINPLIVWEVKEYYYATTFGSRIADGVYETQLDGYEFNEIEQETGRHIEHVFFIDSHRTWWVKGKSYLCRIIDALNRGLVDEVIFGSEVLDRWPELLRQVVEQEFENEVKP